MTVPGWARPPPAALPPPEPRPARSFISVVLAAAQPLLMPPISAESATRASVMKTSLKSACPVISFSGRTSTPSWSISKAK